MLLFHLTMALRKIFTHFDFDFQFLILFDYMFFPFQRRGVLIDYGTADYAVEYWQADGLCDCPLVVSYA